MVLTNHLSHLLGKKAIPQPIHFVQLLQVEVATHAFKGDISRTTPFSEKECFVLLGGKQITYSLVFNQMPHCRIENKITDFSNNNRHFELRCVCQFPLKELYAL